LVEGGNGSAVQEVPLASAELYDPKTGKFNQTRALIVARDAQTATLLDGQVLVAGDDGRTGELYDQAAGKFSPAGSMIVARNGHTASLLQDGRVLLVGGWDGVSVQMGSGTTLCLATRDQGESERLTVRLTSIYVQHNVHPNVHEWVSSDECSANSADSGQTKPRSIPEAGLE
jgi:hypothetical protein